MTISNQSECFISVYHSYATQKIVYDISSGSKSKSDQFLPQPFALSN